MRKDFYKNEMSSFELLCKATTGSDTAAQLEQLSVGFNSSVAAFDGLQSVFAHICTVQIIIKAYCQHNSVLFLYVSP